MLCVGEEEQWDVNVYLKWWEAKKKKIAAKKALLQLAKDEREFSRFRSKAVDVKEEDEASDVSLDGLSYEDAHLAFDIEKSPKLD